MPTEPAFFKTRATTHSATRSSAIWATMFQPRTSSWSSFRLHGPGSPGALLPATRAFNHSGDAQGYLEGEEERDPERRPERHSEEIRCQSFPPQLRKGMGRRVSKARGARHASGILLPNCAQS